MSSRQDFMWWWPSDPGICSRCRIAIPDEWIPLEVHVMSRSQILRFCLECAPVIRRSVRRWIAGA